jgi:hypothetical protein
MMTYMVSFDLSRLPLHPSMVYVPNKPLIWHTRPLFSSLLLNFQDDPAKFKSSSSIYYFFTFGPFFITVCFI